MSQEKISVVASRFPQIATGKYRINVASENEIFSSASAVDFMVSGFMYNLPQTELVSVYPPKDGQGNYGGVFPFVQFRRNSLPWDFEIRDGNVRIPYLFLIIFEENELDFSGTDDRKVQIKTENTSFLDPCYEKDKAFTYLTIPQEKMVFLPEMNELKNLAHVRIDGNKSELQDFPEETSVVISKRMVFPEKKYTAFIASYIERKEEKIRHSDKTSQLIVLYQWQFEAVSHNSYQFNETKFEGLSDVKRIKKRKTENPVLNGELELMKFLEKSRSGFEPLLTKLNSGEKERRELLSVLKYEGKTLKGMLQELQFSEISMEWNPSAGNKKILDLIDLGKFPLLHQLKSGGKVVSWYHGPFVRNAPHFEFKNLTENPDSGIDLGENIPDHSEKLMFYNRDTKMLDMGYSAAWQLGRLLLLNNPKVLQELQKWKHQLKINELLSSQNAGYSPITLAVDNSVRQLPDLVKNFIISLTKFTDFPYYYLFPHESILPDEAIRYFKLDNSWVLSLLFGVFSAGEYFSIENFRSYVLNDSEFSRVFNFKQSYYGFLINSEIVVNWPQLNIEADYHSDFKFITALSPAVRLYLLDDPFTTITLSMANENAHFAIDFPNDYRLEQKEEPDGILRFSEDQDGIKYTVSGFENNVYKNKMPFDLLFMQPKITYSIR